MVSLGVVSCHQSRHKKVYRASSGLAISLCPRLRTPNLWCIHPDTLQGSINKHISRYEISAVYTHPAAKADIVLVHGLNGDPERTWTAAASGVFWPADLLPASLRGEPANVLVYGYNADVFHASW